ncbi:cellulose biosynthesis protein BcsE [Klebsiella pneumoniae]|uniref:Cellulose biosynthesis protein BcsE n=1 Tax=Klebsiella pneumoniae TaxID=573 RepID=A0A377VY18_KLEPN|nr:cellulose biosynthesis protein BcsE [Klebsiella pneumoniae]
MRVLSINSAQDIDRQLTPLLREYRSLSGLASIRYQGDRHIFDIAWWGSDKGISAQQQLMVQHDDAGWRLAQDAETSVQPRSDEKAILSHVRVLEGAPPLSEYWTLFDTNDEVFNAGRTAQAATILFSITQNTQIEQLGRYIHTLRRQRGTALKIIVREQTPSLRATDERLLLSSGASLVIPSSASLSPLPDANRKRTEPKVLPPYPGRFCHPADLEPAVKAARLPEVGCPSAKRCTT